MVLTRKEKLLRCKSLIDPYRSYLQRGYGYDVVKISEERGLKHDNGKQYTVDQIRHVVSGSLAIVELAEVIAEVGRRNQEAMEKLQSLDSIQRKE